MTAVVEAVAASLSVDNSMVFDKSAEGTKAMFRCATEANVSWRGKLKGMFDSGISKEEADDLKRKASEDYFGQ